MTSAKRLPTPPRDPRSGQQPGRARSNAVWIIAAVVLVVVGAFVVALAANSSSSSPDTSPTPAGTAGTVVANGSIETAPVTITGEALPTFEGTGNDAAVGLTAPTLSGVDFAGQPITIGTDGKPKVIMFVAHWCPHCQAEVPRIQNWLDANGMPSDVSLYTVATATTDTRPNYPPSDWLVSKNWTVPVMVDSADYVAGSAFGLSSYPYFVVVGADGKVVTRTSGELTMDQFEGLITAARAGKVS